MGPATAPIISVVIPTRNRPSLVVRAVKTALAQSLTQIEVIVIIDGFDVETSEALEAIKDVRLHAVSLPASVGGSDARNIGVSRSRGEFIAFLDDDDEWSPDKLTRQLKAARESNQPYPVVTCRLIARRPSGDEV